jgi:hypothetical protein
MKRGLLLGMAVALMLSLPALAATIVDNSDSIIVGSVTMVPGQDMILVPVYFVTHEDVTHYTLPLEIQSSGGIHFQGYVLGEALQDWDDNWQGLSNDRAQALHLGFADLGGENNVPLNTGGRRAEVFELSVSIDQHAAASSAVILPRSDSRAGQAVFGQSDGLHGKTPVIVTGTIALGVADKPALVPLPTEVSLSQNYPNPFNPTTEIEFAMPESRLVKLTVFNVLGQEVRSLVSGMQEAGYHKITWDGRSNAGIEVPSGAYFYRLETGDYSRSMKMILLK